MVSSGERDSNNVEVMIKLPTNITEEVSLTAELDGRRVKHTTLIPSERRVWRVALQGEGWCRLDIYLEDELLYEYEVDFDYEDASMIEDYTNDFKNW